LDRILVDTSVWIEFFRKKDPFYYRVLKLLDEDRICCIGIILAELIQGAKSKEEIQALKDFSYVFPFLEESRKLWEKAGELSFELMSVGKQIGLADCYISVAANNENIGILTRDNHFMTIKEHLNIILL